MDCLVRLTKVLTTGILIGMTASVRVLEPTRGTHREHGGRITNGSFMDTDVRAAYEMDADKFASIFH